jgi:hypothetical protein
MLAVTLQFGVGEILVGPVNSIRDPFQAEFKDEARV